MTHSGPQAQIELFHLLFLKQVSEKVDRSHFCLKGGCNLRFYFKSIRYSEDIDLDIKTVARDTLKNRVTKLLEGTPFQQILRTRQLALLDVSAPKQTDTTQRWKLKIRGPGSSLPIPTKIEFSRRGFSEGVAFEAVDPEVIRFHQLYPVLATHYTGVAALQQKIQALIHRTETQARDVFDLNLLLERYDKVASLPLETRDKDRALSNLVSVSYPDYQGQVVSYLLPEYQDHFGSADSWNRMQETVLKFVESAPPTEVV